MDGDGLMAGVGGSDRSDRSDRQDVSDAEDLEDVVGGGRLIAAVMSISGVEAG